MRTASLLSAEDFARVAHILGPCQLVEGEIIPMSPGGARHSRVTVNASVILDAHVRAQGVGRTLSGEAGFVVRRHPDTVRGADVAYISYERLPKGKLDDAFLSVPPELVIEVLSTDVSWAEMEKKVAEYHTFGVDLVWVVDPQTRTLRAYPQNRTPVLVRDSDEVSADPLVPGFSVRVSRFFED